MKRALFLDRDGVLDELVYYQSSGEWESPRNVADVRMTEGIAEPLQRAVDAGWLLFIVSNQPSYAKGKTSREELDAVQQSIIERLPVPIAHSYLCFHRAEELCACRKPSPKFLLDAQVEFDIDLTESWMIGDQDSDLACGRAAGCKVALIEHPRSAQKRGTIEPDVRGFSLEDVLEQIL